MIDIHPNEIAGPWVKGFALDDHTVHSDYLGEDEFGHPQFETRRSEMGELLYRLKFKGDTTVLKLIADTAADFIRSRDLPADLVVPVPPSNIERAVLPSLAVGEGIAERLQIPVCCDCVVKVKQTPELKNLFDRSARSKALENAFRASESELAGRSVLLFDDLFRSGATLGAVTGALYASGKAAEVYGIALTKTRRLR